MRRTMLGVVLSTALVVVPSTTFAQSMNLWVGTKWKLNIAKSKYDPGPPPFASLATAYDIANGVTRVTGDSVDAQGQKAHVVILITFDGKEQPVVGLPQPEKVTWTHKWINERTYEWVAKTNVQVTGTSRVVMSRDGKTATLTTTGKNPQGQTVKNVLLFEKQ